MEIQAVARTVHYWYWRNFGARYVTAMCASRVHFDLAENRKDEVAPFAFLATCTTRLSAHAKAQHLLLHVLRRLTPTALTFKPRRAIGAGA